MWVYYVWGVWRSRWMWFEVVSFSYCHSDSELEWGYEREREVNASKRLSFWLWAGVGIWEGEREVNASERLSLFLTSPLWLFVTHLASLSPPIGVSKFRCKCNHCDLFYLRLIIVSTFLLLNEIRGTQIKKRK